MNVLNSVMGKFLSTNLEEASAIPYFLWDEPMTVEELIRRLKTATSEERIRLLGKILREARDTDVWKFTTPQEVESKWKRLLPHLGRRRRFWEFLFDHWRREELIGGKQT